MQQPTLETPRLILRPFAPTDEDRIRELCGARQIADTTLNIPHPYPKGAAVEWIATHAPGFAAGTLANFAIASRESGDLIGAVGLVINPTHAHAELGYWIGVPYWGRGYATEAARTVVGFGFEPLGLHRIFATHFTRNPASGRIMQKIGMRREGLCRGAVRKWDRYEDLVLYALLADDLSASPP